MNPYTTLALARMLGQGGQSYLDEKRRIEAERLEKRRDRRTRRLDERDYAFRTREYESKIERQDRLDKEAAEEKARKQEMELMELLRDFAPEGYAVRPEVLNPRLRELGALPALPPPSPAPFVNQREQGMAAKMGRQIPQQQFTPPQVQSPFVPIEKGPDAKYLSQYNSMMLRAADAAAQGNDPSTMSAIFQGAAAAYKAATGKDLTVDQFNYDAMTAYESAKVRQGDESLDIKRTLAEDTIRHHKAVEAIQAMNAQTAKARAEYDKAYKDAQIGLQAQGGGMRKFEIVANLQNQLARLAVSRENDEIPADSADAIAIGIKSLLRDLGSPVNAPSGGGQAGVKKLTGSSALSAAEQQEILTWTKARPGGTFTEFWEDAQQLYPQWKKSDAWYVYDVAKKQIKGR